MNRAAPAAEHPPLVSPGWLRGPLHDLVMAFVWVPFALLALGASHDPDRLRLVVAATIVFSFAHQPLTLWLAYGDAAQRRAHRTFFLVAPLVVVLAVALGSSAWPEAVALVAGAWNVLHTIRQRYGVSRLYGRLSGIDTASDNRLLCSWLALAVVVALARTDIGRAAHDVALSPRNISAIDALASVRGVALLVLPVAVAIAAILTMRAVVDERERPQHSVPRLCYLASTAMLLALLAFNPVVGFVAYVGSHAAEYLLMVRWRIDRAAERTTVGDRVGAVARRIGSGGTLLLYAVVVALLIVFVRSVQSLAVVTLVLTFGALHFLYDGVLWRSPRR